MKGYPVDPILGAIRDYVRKTQGRWTVAVPEAGTGDRSRFGCLLHCEGKPVGSVYAREMAMHFAGEWPGPLEQRLPGKAEDLGFKVTTQFVHETMEEHVIRNQPYPTAAALQGVAMTMVETGRMALPKCPQCRGTIEIHTNGVKACTSCGYRFTPRGVTQDPVSVSVIDAPMSHAAAAAVVRPHVRPARSARDPAFARRIFQAVMDVIRSEDESG